MDDAKLAMAVAIIFIASLVCVFIGLYALLATITKSFEVLAKAPLSLTAVVTVWGVVAEFILFTFILLFLALVICLAIDLSSSTSKN